MVESLTAEQIREYGEKGFLVVRGFLNQPQLTAWREAIDNAVAAVEASHPAPDSLSEEGQYYRNVFTQCVNLWKTSKAVEQLVVDPRLGKLATDISGATGVRLYHDHALVKQPWANPTNFHVDNPYDPFYSAQATMLWIALDDATLQNGCLYFLPGTHKESHFEIGGNLSQTGIGDLFREYPEWSRIEPVATEMAAGDAVFISGLIAHAAGPNMTIHPRRAFSMLYMPEDATFNGKQSALPDEVFERLKEGDLLEDSQHLPLLYSSR
jgi:phytanoyl-CoA hydroxylase